MIIFYSGDEDCALHAHRRDLAVALDVAPDWDQNLRQRSCSDQMPPPPVFAAASYSRSQSEKFQKRSYRTMREVLMTASVEAILDAVLAELVTTDPTAMD